MHVMYKNEADAAIAKVNDLVAEMRAVSEDATLTAAQKRERVERINTEMGYDGVTSLRTATLRVSRGE
jgi:hypothetical protein